MKNSSLLNAAEINNDMPTRIEWTSSGCQASEVLEAIYVPTLGKRSELPIYKAARDTGTVKEIYVLPSTSVPSWFDPKSMRGIEFSKSAWENFLALPSSENPSSKYLRNYDLPFKRNTAIAHAKTHGLRAIGLVDDDIKLDSGDIRYACSLVRAKPKRLVSFHVLDFPDVSVIDHIERYITRNPSRVSVGGNALFLNPQSIDNIFPYCYNEDWLFILSLQAKGFEVISAGIAKQLPHEPWNDIERIRFEQFGEIIVFGIKSSLKNGIDWRSLTRDTWQSLIIGYRKRLESLLDLSTNSTWLNTIKVALGVVADVTAEEVSEFLAKFLTETRK